MKTVTAPLIAASLFATAALPHTGVQNPTVKAWMAGMENLAAATKTLGQMAKGEVAFDARAARSALDEIETHAARIPALFQTRASDPRSEARPAIWTNWDQFVALSDDLSQVAASSGVGDLDRLRQTLKKIGAACNACHSDFRD